MLRSLPRVASPYRVLFTPQTWKAVGQMPTAVFEVFEQAVNDLADKSGRLNATLTGEQGPLRLKVGELEIVYERDDAARLITLVDIIQAQAPSR